MTVTHELTLDLVRPGLQPVIHAVQGDSCARVLALSVYADGVPWQIPQGVSVTVRCGKSDGTCCVYDTLPDGTTAWTAEDNLIRVTLAPQALTAPGVSSIQIVFTQDEQILSTFTLLLSVQRDPSRGKVSSENYVNLLTDISRAVALWLEQHPEATTTVQDGSIGEEKLTEELRSRLGSGGGLNAAARALLITILRNGVYTADQSANITALEAALAESGGESTPDVPVEPDPPIEPDEPETPEVTLTSISATYTGGDVEAGTTTADLEGITVTAHYSDGTTKNLTDYSLSHTTFAEGENTVTVAYGGKSATFTVTGVYVEPEDGVLYSLAAPLTTDGTNRIDTGVALLSEEKDWSVCFDYEALDTLAGDAVFTIGEAYSIGMRDANDAFSYIYLMSAGGTRIQVYFNGVVGNRCIGVLRHTANSGTVDYDMDYTIAGGDYPFSGSIEPAAPLSGNHTTLKFGTTMGRTHKFNRFTILNYPMTDEETAAFLEGGEA